MFVWSSHLNFAFFETNYTDNKKKKKKSCGPFWLIFKFKVLLFVDKFNCKHICKSRGFVALTSEEVPPLGESNQSWGLNQPLEFKFSRPVPLKKIDTTLLAFFVFNVHANEYHFDREGSYGNSPLFCRYHVAPHPYS